MKEYRPLGASNENEVKMKTNGIKGLTERLRGNFSKKKNEYFIHLIFTELNSDKSNNKISTSKYTWYNMLPKIIIEQFSKMANLYFLIIAILQSIKEISYSGGQPVILLPLFFVVSINGIKDIFEDLKRKRSDDNENNRKCKVYNRIKKTFIDTKWSDIKLGDVIRVEKDEPFPCDLLLMNTSEKNATCYIETQSIDGETSLKLRQANRKLSALCGSELQKIHKIIKASPPNENIYDFNARIYQSSNGCIVDNDFIVVDNSSLLLRGCSLKRTSFIYGAAVYVGHNTKSMMNAPKARAKTSKVEDIMNRQILIVFVVQISMAVIASLFSLIGFDKHLKFLQNYIYVEKDFKKSFTIGMFFTKVGTWILIFTNFVPISLLVTMEMIKFVQGIFISWDADLYVKGKGGAKVQTSTLNEELGQVNYILSDKTGTLTMNNMVFKKLTIGNNIYGDKRNSNKIGESRKKDQWGDITNCDFVDYEGKLEKDINLNLDMVIKFMECVSLCHSVIVDEDENIAKNIIKYNASSPDEMSLVNFARSAKFVFKGKSIEGKMIVDVNGREVQYEVLNVLEYTSERKRMSVIIKMPDGTIRLYAKGADSVILPLPDQCNKVPQQIICSVDKYARDGYRTLVFAYNDLNPNFYNDWSQKYNEAITETPQNKKKIDSIVSSVEANLNVLGVTAIDDQLQPDVPSTLESLMSAGIKVWMLTGDKTDTAKSIAYSCKLISTTNILDSKALVLEVPENSSIAEIRPLLSQFIQTASSSSNSKYSLIVSSRELSLITSMNLSRRFFRLASKCQSVICARVTPHQKSEMISLIKSHDYGTVLAIGDGANDVKMITKADVGVGIMGAEGSHAARASDYSIMQFSHLKKLLLVHGRESYRKNSLVVCYNFYKNALFVVPQFWMGMLNFFSGQTLYDRWIYQFFNPIFTCLPIIWYGIYDIEMDPKELMSKPIYYVQGMISKLFHFKRFWKWMFCGIIDALFAFVIGFFSLSSSNNGKNIDMWGIGTMVYSSVVIIANLKLIIYTNTHSIISTVIFLISILSYFIVVLIMSFFPVFYNFDNFYEIILEKIYYFSSLLVISLCALVDIAVSKSLLYYGIVQSPTHCVLEPSMNQFDVESIEEDVALLVENEN